MNSRLELDRFVTSQRAKLVEEKSRLQRRVNGILPSDSVAMEKNDKLRRERQLEYQEHMKKDGNFGLNHSKGGGHGLNSKKFPPSTPKKKSVAEIRQNFSREREREFQHNRAGLNQDAKRSGDYASLRERKLAEERQYRGNSHNHDFRRNEYDNGGHSKARFVSDKPPRGFNWEEEETNLMEWTRNQAHSSNQRAPHRAQTPPTKDSLHMKRSTSRSSMRSISAPVVAPPITGIAALGQYEDSRVKRLRQLKYAEELRSQMKEKQVHATAWRNTEDQLNVDGLRRRGTELGARGEEHAGERQAAPRREHHRFSGDPPNLGSHHPQYSHEDPHSRPPVPPHQYECGEDREERQHYRNPPGRNQAGEGYGYYQHPYGPPPPPPPRFQGYGGWGPPYYPYPPPHGPGYEHDPYNMYHPHPHYDRRTGDNPYPPPRPHPSSHYWSDEDRRDGESSRDGKGVPRKQPSESEAEVSPLLGGGNSRGKSDKMAYRRELEKQMEEKKKKVVEDKFARESFEKQKNTEIYDPFGKGGCGAPVRDQFGNLVADLKQMRKINENRLSNKSPLSQRRSKDGAVEGSESPLTGNSPRTTILTYSKDNEDTKKATLDSYRDYLQRQVKEKEELKRREKERVKLEEEKELEQLEKDRKRLQEEYRQELDRQRRKEEEARRKNEEIKQQAEIKRQIAIMQQEQEALHDAAERKALAERALESSFSPTQPRAESPPIPTLRHKMKQFSEVPPRTPDRPEPSSFRSSSPPVPTLRKKQAKSKKQGPVDSVADRSANADSHRPDVGSNRRSPQPMDSRQLSRQPIAGSRHMPDPAPHSHPQESISRVHSHDYFRQRTRVPSGDQGFASAVSPPRRRPQSSESEQNTLLTQLGAIRMHLQTELAKQTSQHSDIFEKAKQQKPKIAAPKVLRPKDAAALHDFTKLKNESSRRQDFLEEYPQDPDSVSMLELQQQALLRHQQNKLAMAQRGNARHRRQREELPAVDSPALGAHTSQVSRNPFADSASISNADSAQRPRRQWERGRVPSPGGRSKLSVSTLEVEDMAARNEERMKRLEAILNSGAAQHDNDSRSNYFPPSSSAVTGRPGMSRQSELSLDCDTQHLPAQ